MPQTRVLVDRTALGLLGASIVLAAAFRVLEPWSSRTLWVLWWGFGIYALAVASAYLLRPEATDPDLRAMHAIRRRILARLGNYLVGGQRRGQPQVAQLRAQARESFDEEILPAFRLLVDWKKDLRGELERIAAGKSARPSPEFIDRARTLRDTKQVAVERALELAANADAEVYALLQELEHGAPADSVIDWQQSLDRLHGHLAEALRLEPPAVPVEPESVEPAPPPSVSALPVEPALMPPEAIVRAVSQALRDLNKTARLERSELIDLLPGSLGVARGRWAPRNGQEPTPEEKAHALVGVLNGAIDRLKPPDGSDAARTRQDVHYKILHEEYRLGMSTTHIMVRLEVGDAQFYRWRHEAVSAVARDLVAREERLTSGGVNPTAMDYLG